MTVRAFPLIAVVVASSAGACHHGATPATGPSCVQVADHVLALLDAKNERAHPIRDVFYKRCTADAWPVEARACIVDESSIHGGRHCKDRLPGTARESLDHDLADVDSPTLPAQCEHYTEVYEASQRCDKLSTSARQRIATQYKELSARVGKGDRDAIVDACTTRAQGVAKDLTAGGCDADQTP